MTNQRVRMNLDQTIHRWELAAANVRKNPDVYPDQRAALAQCKQSRDNLIALRKEYTNDLLS